ncbi:hypothetical protein BJ138DRAFT_1141085 [Hygrophoropsis aurantiaca]|uniref:Uncharacterized protein n=1 Tax=Hygrophoropsis aurantiaca TaxID=72124 RepID=A0ACB8ASC6_9AGAM|nr:hypothetical protein BJ138DRAFT_1141085 [Hygrophoropsis aurantiaca]
MSISYHTNNWPVPRSREDRQSLKGRLAQYEQDLAVLEPQLAALRHRILEIKMQLAHARLLPMDVVYEILDRWTEVDPDAPLTARRICSQWRDATSYHARTWRKIHVNSLLLGRNAKDKWKTWIENARNTLLDMSIHWVSQDQQEMSEEEWAYGNAENLLMTKIVSMTSSSAYHWRSLSIRFDTWRILLEIIKIFASHQLSRVSLVHMKELSIVAEETPGHSPYIQEFPENFWLFNIVPHLRSFSCLGIRPRPVSFFATLQSLTLGRFDYETTAAIIPLVEACPALEELSLIDQQIFRDEERGKRTMLTHRSLRRLRLLETSYVYEIIGDEGLINSVLPMLNLPNLSQLQLGKFGEEGVWHPSKDASPVLTEATEIGETLLDFIKRSNPPLEAMQLVGIPMNDAQLFACLCHMPRMRYLEIKVSNVGADLFWALAEVDQVMPPHASIVCPALEYLHLVGCPGVSGDALLALARSRGRLNKRWVSEDKANNEHAEQQDLRPLKALQVHACPEVDQYAADIDAALPNRGFLFTGTGDYGDSSKIYHLSSIPFEWDEMLSACMN